MISPETAPRRGLELRSRYTAADVGVLTADEARRFVRLERGDPRTDITLAWELLYRLEPELYDRLVGAERLHPGVLGWLPDKVERIVEVAAGTGRLTLELSGAPARCWRSNLPRRCARSSIRSSHRADHGHRARVSMASSTTCPSRMPALTWWLRARH